MKNTSKSDILSIIDGSKITLTTSAWPVRLPHTCSYVGFSTCPPEYPGVTSETPLSPISASSTHQKQPPPRTISSRESSPVVGGFASYFDIMDVALGQPCIGNPNELTTFLHVSNATISSIAHG